MGAHIDDAVEAMVTEKGLTAPRITKEHLDGLIERVQYYAFPLTTLTVCCLTLRNGYSVTGESAASSPENFDAEVGRSVAYAEARDKIWALEGYLLRQRLHEMQDQAPHRVLHPAEEAGAGE